MKIERNEYYLIILLALFLLLLIWSLIKPYDLILWFIEVAPAIIGTILLIVTYPKFVFTKTTYVWWFIAACLMTVGAHYSYSHVPIFNWLKDIFNWDRNNYDKLGHVVQGVIPVLMIRELLIKKVKLTNIVLVNIMALFVTIGISALYEIIEWLTLYIETKRFGDFLGEQGFRWDTQSDMFMALIGGGLAILFSRNNIKPILNSVNALEVNEQPD